MSKAKTAAVVGPELSLHLVKIQKGTVTTIYTITCSTSVTWEQANAIVAQIAQLYQCHIHQVSVTPISSVKDITDSITALKAEEVSQQ